jgi:chromosome partitioning protein
MTVVVFGAEKGGVGKTSLALNFTVLAAKSKVDVVLLDTDRQKTASNWLALRTEDSALTKVSVLANSADPLREMSSLSTRYELVVVDIGAQNYRSLIECAILADIYIIPTSTSALDLDVAEDLYTLLQRTKATRNHVPAHLVVTKAPPHPQSREVSRTITRLKQADISVLKTVVPLRSAWRSMANTGKALHELTGKDFDERASSEMLAVYQEMVKTLSKSAKGSK